MQTIIQTPTRDLKESILFYKKLNFNILDNNIVTDGKVFIEINEHQFARVGIKFYKKDWTSILINLEKVVNITEIEDAYLFAMPSGTWVYLMKKELNTVILEAEKSFSTLGNFAGVSLESTDIQKSTQILEFLGFTKTMGKIEQGWVAYTNKKGFGISIMKPMMCPHSFLNPSLTYFNGLENKSIISKIRTLEIPIEQEITHFNKEGIVDNIILRDGGGLGFFLFSD